MASLQGLTGLILIPLLAWLISENRRAFNWRVPVAGLAMQLILALLLLKLPLFQSLFIQLNKILLGLQQATEAGTSFIFGYLGGAESPFVESGSGSGSGNADDHWRCASVGGSGGTICRRGRVVHRCELLREPARCCGT